MKHSKSPDPSLSEYLSSQLDSSVQLLGQVSDQVKQLLSNRQEKIYHLFTNDINRYLQAIWKNIVEKEGNEDIGQIVAIVAERKQNVESELEQERIRIVHKMPILPFDFQQENKNNKINLLRMQSDSLKKKINQISTNLQGDNSQNETKDIKDIYTKLYSQQKIKQAEQFVKKNKQAQQQRRKNLEQRLLKQSQSLQKKLQQQKSHEQQTLLQRKQKILQKQKQYHQKRQKQKQIRQQRNTEYMRIRKSINERPPLFQKMVEGFSRRYEQEEQERLNRMRSQKREYLSKVDSQVLMKHEREYEEMRAKREKERKERKEKEEKVGAEEAETRSRAKIHSSYQIKKVIDPKQVEKQLAKEKLEKMRQYRSIVKEKFKPKIDEQKRKQLMNMIEQMELNHKRVKRVKLQNGSVMYQQLKSADPKMIGIEYLQMAKQMAAKARERKKQQKQAVQANHSQEIKKPINYLQQLRKNRPKYQKGSFVQRRNMSFDDKIKKVMQESEKLAEITKQNQMMLKFGKFKTSQEILACKQEIDQNYLDIVNMKLKLIMSQQEKNRQGSQNSDF